MLSYISPSSCFSQSHDRGTAPSGAGRGDENTIKWNNENYHLPLETFTNCNWLTEDNFLRFRLAFNPFSHWKVMRPSLLPVRWSRSWCEKEERSTANQSQSRETLKSRLLRRLIGEQYGSWLLVTWLWLDHGGGAAVNTSKAARWLAFRCSWSDILFPVSDFILWVSLHSNRWQKHGNETSLRIMWKCYESMLPQSVCSMQISRILILLCQQQM